MINHTCDMSFSPYNLNLILSGRSGVIVDMNKFVVFHHLYWFRFAGTKDMNTETSDNSVWTATDNETTLITYKQQQ